MRLPFLQKPKHPLALYFKDKYKYSAYKNGKLPEGFKETLLEGGPEAVRAAYPFEADIDPYLSARIREERERRLRQEYEKAYYCSPEPHGNLKRRNAQHGLYGSRWTHMTRCVLCDHDNMHRLQTGKYQCENVYYGKQCRGWFETKPADAKRMHELSVEQRVPYNSLADRYDYDAAYGRNKTRAREMKYGHRAWQSSYSH